MNEIEKAITKRIIYHCDEKKYRYELGKSCLEQCAKDILSDVKKMMENSEWKEVIRGENVSELNPVDGFECSKCGIILEGWVEVEIDEHDRDKSYCEYSFNLCPNCGADMREVEAKCSI